MYDISTKEPGFVLVHTALEQETDQLGSIGTDETDKELRLIQPKMTIRKHSTTHIRFLSKSLSLKEEHA